MGLGAGQSFANNGFAALGQLKTVSGSLNGGTATNGTYSYDGNRKRVKSVVNGRTLYNIYDASGALVHVADFNPLDGGANEYTDYIRAAGMEIGRIIGGQGFNYTHVDALGSPVAITNSLGAVTTRSRYTPFGLALDDPTLLKDHGGFTGHIKDSATGLNYMQARYYDPVMGRFLSVDPVTFMETGEPGYFNRYSYTFNDPVNNTDPTGMCVNAPISCPVGSFGGAITPGHGSTVNELTAAGALIVAIDVATIPSGEGAIGMAMIATAARQAGKDALIGAGINASIDVGVQLKENGGDLSNVDLGQTAQSAAEGGLSGIPGGAAGRQGDRVGRAVSRADTGSLGETTFDKAVEGAARMTTERAGTLGATGGGIASAYNQSQERTACQSGQDESC